MNVTVTLVCEDPEYGLRGHRKYWTATYTGACEVYTEWGRVREGIKLDVGRLANGLPQKKCVLVDSDEEALRFIDKKVAEKGKKGYKVVQHVIDGVNLGVLQVGSAKPDGALRMRTWSGTS